MMKLAEKQGNDLKEAILGLSALFGKKRKRGKSPASSSSSSDDTSKEDSLNEIVKLKP
jgi:hypothetical protein